MSSVKGSDSSNSSREQDAIVRKNRETSQNNEAEMLKKHQREIRRINELHYSEIENLKKSHENQMNELRKMTSEDINARDHKYQKEIEELRSLYRKQQQTQADDNARANEALRKANTNDKRQAQEHKESRIEKLTSDYDKGLKERESVYEKNMAESREQQQNAIRTNREKLERHYEEHAKSLRDERNKTVGGLQKSYDEYRNNAESRFRDQELRHFQDQQRASDNLIRAVNKERLAKQDSEEILRQGFEDGITKTRDRYEKRASQERKLASMARDDLRSDVNSRINDQVLRLEREKQDLKDANVRGEMKMKQENERTINNVMDAYQRNVENYKEQRDAAVRQANDANHKDIAMIRKDYDEQATANNRLHRQMDEERNSIHKKAFETLNRDYQLRNENTKSIADKRVKELYEVTSAEKARLTELQIDNHTASQRAHQDALRQLRATMEQEKLTAVTNLQEQLQRQELQHSERMAQTVSKYEKQILGLKDELIKQKKYNDENMKRMTEDMQRQHKLAMDQLDQQNRDRMRKVDNQHAEELRTVNKRNEAKIDQIMAEVKKT